MNSSPSFKVFQSLIVSLCCLAMLFGCASKSVPDYAGSYMLTEGEKERLPKRFTYADLVISEESVITLWGHKGEMIRQGERFKITFRGKEAEGFKIFGAGYVRKDEVHLWLEFTEAGNCVVYFDKGARFFTKDGNNRKAP